MRDRLRQPRRQPTLAMRVPTTEYVASLAMVRRISLGPAQIVDRVGTFQMARAGAGQERWVGQQSKAARSATAPKHGAGLLRESQTWLERPATDRWRRRRVLPRRASCWPTHRSCAV